MKSPVLFSQKNNNKIQMLSAKVLLSALGVNNFFLFLFAVSIGTEWPEQTV